MKTIFKVFLLVALLLFSADMALAGGGKRTGTGGAAQLMIPVGARGIALAGANVGSTTGIDALYWNPAGVARLNSSVEIGFSHMDYIADIGVEYGAVAADFGSIGVIAFDIKSLSIGDIPVTTVENPDGTGATFTPQMFTAGITYSRLLTERISVGLTASFITETLGQVTASGIAFNLGVLYMNLAGVEGLNFGLAMKNLGPDMTYDGSGLYLRAEAEELKRAPQYYKVEAAPFELPSTFEIGGSYTPNFDDLNKVTLFGSFQNNNFSSDEYKVGLEYGYNDLFFLRGGYTHAPEFESEDYIYGLNFGGGIHYNVGAFDLKVDYAYRDVEYFDGNHVIGVMLGF